MKYALITAALAFGLATPALAEETKAKSDTSTHQSETLHAPTNRVGEMVPTMTSEDGKKDSPANEQAKSGDNKAETMHAPTNRVGKQVPTMKSAENKDDQKKSKTYNNDKTSTE